MGCGASIDAVNEEQPSSYRVSAPRLPSLHQQQQQAEEITKPRAVEKMSSGKSDLIDLYH